MLFFSTPLLLLFAGVIAVLGLWALWRGKHAGQKISSTKLWRGLNQAAAGNRRRLVDPLWLLVFLAALLAGLALAGPAWRIGQNSAILPSAKIEWSVRSLQNAPPELFLRVTNPQNVSPPFTLEFLSKPDAPPDNKTISPEDAAKGITLIPPFDPAARKISVRFRAAQNILAAATFTQPARPPFALLTRAAPGRAIDPALAKVFTINPAAVPADPRIHPAVLLVDDPHFSLDGLSPDTLIIGSPETPLPGISLQPAFTPPEKTAPIPLSLPSYITLTDVQVRTARAAALSPEWTINATLDHKPWLATRKLPAGPTLLWLASRPSTDTDWPLDRSFVLFFANALDSTFPSAAAGATLDWQKADTTPAPNPTSEIPLANLLGILALVLLLTAITLLVWNTRET